jgi:hypothetical protein
MSILLKRNTNPGVIPDPSELVPGEIAINTADAALYTKNEDGEVITLASASDLPLPTTIPWDNITGKPSFQFEEHTHSPEDIIGTAVITTDPRLSNSRNPLPHNHNIANVDGLQNALNGKSDSSHNHDTRYYTETEVDTLLNGKANSVHGHPISDITDLNTTLGDINNDITSLQTGKQDAGNYAASVHSHVVSDINDLTSTLSNYATSTHDHSYPNFLTKIGFNAAANVPTATNPDGVSSLAITAVGYSACNNNTTGWQNTGVGNVALFSNTTGVANTGVGSLALQFNTSGGWNTAIGIGSLRNNTTGLENTALGSVALHNNTTGAKNTALGQAGLWNNTVGSNNISIGYGAEVNASNYNNCIIIGTDARAYRSSDFVLGSPSSPVSVSTSVGTSGAAETPPVNPLGYLEVRLNGTLVKIPYYRT